jgi:hypothetical protein
VADDDIAGPKHRDAIAVLSRAATVEPHPRDPIAADDRAVGLLLAGPHLDAVIADIRDVVAGDLELARIECEDAGPSDVGSAVVEDASRTLREHEAVAGEIAEVAILDHKIGTVPCRDEIVLAFRRRVLALEADAV